MLRHVIGISVYCLTLSSSILSFAAAPEPEPVLHPLPIHIELTVPHSGWRAQIWKVIELDNEYAVIVRLGQKRGEMFSQVISQAEASLTLDVERIKPVYYYILNKLWSWDNQQYPFQYRMVGHIDELELILNDPRQMYEAEDDPGIEFDMSRIFPIGTPQSE